MHPWPCVGSLWGAQWSKPGLRKGKDRVEFAAADAIWFECWPSGPYAVQWAKYGRPVLLWRARKPVTVMSRVLCFILYMLHTGIYTTCILACVMLLNTEQYNYAIHTSGSDAAYTPTNSQNNLFGVWISTWCRHDYSVKYGDKYRHGKMHRHSTYWHIDKMGMVKKKKIPHTDMSRNSTFLGFLRILGIRDAQSFFSDVLKH